jgi:hypothetical protein
MSEVHDINDGQYTTYVQTNDNSMNLYGNMWRSDLLIY